MSNQYEILRVEKHELEQYWESRWHRAYGTVRDFSDGLREVLREHYYKHNLPIEHALIAKAEEACTQLVESDAADPLYEAVEAALPDTLPATRVCYTPERQERDGAESMGGCLTNRTASNIWARPGFFRASSSLPLSLPTTNKRALGLIGI